MKGNSLVHTQPQQAVEELFLLVPEDLKTLPGYDNKITYSLPRDSNGL